MLFSFCYFISFNSCIILPLLLRSIKSFFPPQCSSCILQVSIHKYMLALNFFPPMWFLPLFGIIINSFFFFFFALRFPSLNNKFCAHSTHGPCYSFSVLLEIHIFGKQCSVVEGSSQDYFYKSDFLKKSSVLLTKQTMGLPWLMGGCGGCWW